jgi:V/A-type H+-transporting ATPase subunit I
MIVPMSKVYVAASTADRRGLLNALGHLGVVHLAPVDPTKAVADEKTLATIDHLGRAIQILSEIAPSGRPIERATDQAAQEILDIQRGLAERRSRLANLHRQHEQLAVWGDVRLEQLQQLTAAGLKLRFVTVPAKHLSELRAECVQVLGRLAGKTMLVALADRGEPAALPAEVAELPIPTADRPAIRAEAARINEEIQQAAGRLADLAGLLPQMEAARKKLQRQAAFAVAAGGALAGEDLFAVQGWVPADQAEGLAEALAEQGVPAAVTSQPVEAEDSPPTLLRAPRWARPAEALLKLLGTFPGYREQDVSPAFMIALPIFASMLIGDAGYGLLFLLVPALFYRRLTAKLGKGLVHLPMVFGATALVWGVITGSYFAFGPAEMIQAGGVWASVGKALGRLKLFSVDFSEESRTLLMRISFFLAVIHLSSAHLWRASLKFPDIRFLSSVGWAATLWGVYGLVKMLVLKDAFLGTLYPYLAFGGLAMAMAFASPRKYIIDGVVLGALNSIFPAIATFGDTISYVRLMALCLASSALAINFNKMALDIGILPVSVPLLVITHSLNVALMLIALLAHGVRLNILEFSTNFGMEWSGYPYQPFTERLEES